ncbi:N-acetylmuramic acid 6-phosphate etherase [Paenibacillus hamazuiensis]|uniref:N-acetylmuramic acid 6-phosphate etherase n=1 Tax=Paenibacillus hamazuiensis TaxID=2936508 RepID=UPI00200C94D7|nr:N-acetylmuramic acid 6-phosphate etherase [Paenibacillus hamazuiensis]
MDLGVSQPVTEQRNERTVHLDRLSIRETLEVMNAEDQTVAVSVQKALPQVEAAVIAIVQRMKQGGRLFYIGAGTSGRLGILDASECPPTFGVEKELVTGIIAGGETAIVNAVENAEDDEEAGVRDIAALVSPRDAVVGITASGRTPYVLGAIREANRIGSLTVGVSCNEGTPLSRAAVHGIEVPVGPEVVTGSTRLKAGTAQKMVLNMISTTAMIQLGKVYGNLMVNVQATNLKLRDRVVRIVIDATGADRETAEAYSLRADGDARVAILMLKFGIDRTQALNALRSSGEHFGEAMKLLERK